MKSHNIRKCYLYGLFTFAFMLKSASLANVDNEGAESADYDYSEDEENLAELSKGLKSTILPYFEEGSETVNVKLGSKVVLQCPARNYAEAIHSILWYKDNVAITNGPTALTTDYELENNNLNLIIKKITEKDIGHYHCSIMPKEIKHYINVKIAKDTVDKMGVIEVKKNETTTTNAVNKIYDSTLILFGALFLPIFLTNI